MCAAIRSAVSFDMFDVDGSGTLDEVRLRPRHALTHTLSLSGRRLTFSRRRRKSLSNCAVS